MIVYIVIKKWLQLKYKIVNVKQKTKLKNITAHFQKVESEILRTHQLVGDEWLWNWWETITQEFIPIIACITTISFYIEKKIQLHMK